VIAIAEVKGVRRYARPSAAAGHDTDKEAA
jgi:hypothetical protein